MDFLLFGFYEVSEVYTIHYSAGENFDSANNIRRIYTEEKAKVVDAV